MNSIVLAGGFAKRMWPLTKYTPKQLLDVAGKPMLAHVLKSLERINPERVIISVNSFFESHFEDFLKSYDGPLNLELFVELSNNEEEKLGALIAPLYSSVTLLPVICIISPLSNQNVKHEEHPSIVTVFLSLPFVASPPTSLINLPN